uniref:SCP domain-containing protein n=1 Tax=Mesocestoides corti TaxID=53468 RepID=A0A5K3FUT8_MESCO
MMHTFIFLLTLAGYVSATTVPTAAERDELVEIFTGIRENVTPPANNMSMLSYSFKMEDVAADWVTKCLFWYPDIQGANMLLQDTGRYDKHFQTAGFYANQAKNYNFDDNTCKGNCRWCGQRRLKLAAHTISAKETTRTCTSYLALSIMYPVATTLKKGRTSKEGVARTARKVWNVEESSAQNQN